MRLFPSPPSSDDAVLSMIPSLSLTAFNRLPAIVPCAQKGFSRWGTMNRRNRMCWWDCFLYSQIVTSDGFPAAERMLRKVGCH